MARTAVGLCFQSSSDALLGRICVACCWKILSLIACLRSFVQTGDVVANRQVCDRTVGGCCMYILWSYNTDVMQRIKLLLFWGAMYDMCVPWSRYCVDDDRVSVADSDAHSEHTRNLPLLRVPEHFLRDGLRVQAARHRSFSRGGSSRATPGRYVINGPRIRGKLRGLNDTFSTIGWRRYWGCDNL